MNAGRRPEGRWMIEIVDYRREWPGHFARLAVVLQTRLGSHWAKFLFTERAGDRRAHVHVREAGRPNQRYALLFRDYLVNHPTVAAAYAELKRRLAATLADHRSYPEVKDPAVDLIYLAAEAWAAAVAWSPAEPGDLAAPAVQGTLHP